MKSGAIGLTKSNTPAKTKYCIKMKTREIFQLGCQKISEQLIPFGFKSTQKGQLLKKVSGDKKLTFEIHFQSSMRNSSSNISLCPYISIGSEQLKKWQKEKNSSDNENGLIFLTRLENITPLKNKNYDWNIVLSNQENIIPKLIDLIKTYGFPVFDRFENIDQVIAEISENGLKLNEHFATKHQNLPIDFLCFFGNQNLAQNAFDNYLKEQKLLGNAKRVFEELKTSEQNSNKFITDLTMRSAYFNDLKINE
jgi:hypothetical protein